MACELPITKLMQSAQDSALWRVSEQPVRGFSWAMFQPLKGVLAESGYKIHVSLGEQGYLRAIDVLTSLISVFPQVNFKMASSLSGVSQLNAGLCGRSQIGKIWTIYPSNKIEFETVVDWLTTHIQDFDGPLVAGEELCRPNTTISFRFGGFVTYFFENEKGKPVKYLKNSETQKYEIDIYPEISNLRPKKLEVFSSPSGRTYHFGKTIKVGTTQVHQAVDLEDFSPVYIKSKSHALAVVTSPLQNFELYNEYKLLTDVQNLSIACQPVDYWVSNKTSYLVLKKVNGYTLSRAPFDLKWTFARGLVRSLATLHKKNIVHGDLKLENAIGQNDEVCLIDFGNARKTGQVVSDMRTPGHSAPELCARTLAHPAQDIYALGACLFHLATGINPSFIPEGNQRLQRLVEISNLSNSTQSLILACLSNDPNQRPSASACFELIGDKNEF
jgi:hypothetical protein